jgi:ATP-dependent DNA helicase RecQ
VRAEEGRALARLGDGGWDPLVQQGLRAGRFTDELVEAAAEAVRTWGVPVGWVAAIPSRRRPELVPDLARRLAERLGIPFAPVLERVGDGPPQRDMANSHQQVANVRGQFAVTAAPPRGAGLLVDDIRFSGWTLAMVAGQLRGRGAAAVHPLALTSAF